MLHGVGAVQLQGQHGPKDGLAVRRDAQHDLQRRLVRRQVGAAAPVVPGAHGAHLQRVRPGGREPVHHVPRQLGPAAGAGLLRGRGALQEERRRHVRPRRRPRLQDGLQEHHRRPEPRRLQLALAHHEHLLAHRRPQLGPGRPAPLRQLRQPGLGRDLRPQEEGLGRMVGSRLGL